MSIAEIVAINERFTKIEDSIAEHAKLIAELALQAQLAPRELQSKPKVIPSPIKAKPKAKPRAKASGGAE